jgi:hypothetical protein
MAALNLAEYKLRHGPDATFDVGFSRGHCKANFDIVRRLFPWEDLFTTFEEIDRQEHLLSVRFPEVGTEATLGVFKGKRRGAQQRFRARLVTMLNAFATSKREATYEADLVCCWASMCNIPYDYNRNDRLCFALMKVVGVLRDMGHTIYNFQVNTSKHYSSVDMRFLEYAYEQPQCNAENKACLPGPPILTGRADAEIHFRNSIMDCQPPIPPSDSTIPIRKVYSAEFDSATPLSDIKGVIYNISSTFSGVALAELPHISDDDAPTDLYSHVAEPLIQVLDKADPIQLSKRQLVVMRLISTQGHAFHVWGICGKEVPVDEMMVGREDFNGTLVLATIEQGEYRVLSYLCFIDQLCGCFLVKIDRLGRMNTVLETPMRSDVLVPGLPTERCMSAQLSLQEEDRFTWSE